MKDNIRSSAELSSENPVKRTQKKKRQAKVKKRYRYCVYCGLSVAPKDRKHTLQCEKSWRRGWRGRFRTRSGKQNNILRPQYLEFEYCPDCEAITRHTIKGVTFLRHECLRCGGWVTSLRELGIQRITVLEEIEHGPYEGRAIVGPQMFSGWAADRYVNNKNMEWARIRTGMWLLHRNETGE